MGSWLLKLLSFLSLIGDSSETVDDISDSTMLTRKFAIKRNPTNCWNVFDSYNNLHILHVYIMYVSLPKWVFPAFYVVITSPHLFLLSRFLILVEQPATVSNSRDESRMQYVILDLFDFLHHILQISHPLISASCTCGSESQCVYMWVDTLVDTHVLNTIAAAGPSPYPHPPKKAHRTLEFSMRKNRAQFFTPTQIRTGMILKISCIAMSIAKWAKWLVLRMSTISSFIAVVSCN